MVVVNASCKIWKLPLKSENQVQNSGHRYATSKTYLHCCKGSASSSNHTPTDHQPIHCKSYICLDKFYTWWLNRYVKLQYKKKTLWEEIKRKKEKAFRDDRSPGSWVPAMLVYFLAVPDPHCTLLLEVPTPPKNTTALYTALPSCHSSQPSLLR